MTENNPQPFGVDSESFREEYYDNSSQQLKRHIHINSKGEYDHDIADFIFKKAGYTSTYIVVHTTGIPDGVILNLCDENSNQLYSPVDTNKNWTTTACSITVDETDIIPLPAQFNNQLSNHTPFPVGTYNWKLIFAGNDDYEGKELPLTVEIRDFKVWEIQTPTIYPNEEIKVKVQTNANTLYPSTFDISPLLTNNATYDYETGIITYPVSDVNINIGTHTHIINQSNNCFIDYEVMNPIEFYHKGDAYYSAKQQIGYTIKQASLVTTNGPTKNYNILINGQYINTGKYGIKTPSIYNVYTDPFPPGTYHCVVPTITTSNGETYTCEGDFIISTENCSLNLQYENGQTNLVTTYQYNDIPIPNARIGLIDAHTNTLLETTVSDEQGKCTWATTELGVCKSVAYDMRTNEVILESNIIAPLVYNVDIDNNGDLIINKYDNIPNSSINVVDSVIDDEGDLLISTTQYNNINDVEDAIYSINIDENGDIYYNTIGE